MSHKKHPHNLFVKFPCFSKCFHCETCTTYTKPDC